MRCRSRYALAHTSCTHPLTGATPPASRAASPHQHLSVALCRARAVSADRGSLPRLPAMPVADRRSSVAPPLPTPPAPAPATDRRGHCCATARAAPATPDHRGSATRCDRCELGSQHVARRQRGHRRDRGSGAVRHSGAHAAAAMAEAHQVTAEGRGHLQLRRMSSRVIAETASQLSACTRRQRARQT